MSQPHQFCVTCKNTFLELIDCDGSQARHRRIKSEGSWPDPLQDSEQSAAALPREPEPAQAGMQTRHIDQAEMVSGDSAPSTSFAGLESAQKPFSGLPLSPVQVSSHFSCDEDNFDYHPRMHCIPSSASTTSAWECPSMEFDRNCLWRRNAAKRLDNVMDYGSSKWAHERQASILPPIAPGPTGHSTQVMTAMFADAQACQDQAPILRRSKPSCRRKDSSNKVRHSGRDQRQPGKLFVGGLRQEVSADDLRVHFSDYGNISDAVVMTDRFSGISRGFGFVWFTEEEGCHASTLALTQEHWIAGKWVEVKPAVPAGDLRRVIEKPSQQRLLELQSQLRW